MTLRKKLGSRIEQLEVRAAPSTLLGAGISLDPAWHDTALESQLDAPSSAAKQIESGFVAKLTSDSGDKSEVQLPAELTAKPQAILDAVFATRSAAPERWSDSASQDSYAQSVDIDDPVDVVSFPNGDRVIEGASSVLRRTPNGISWTFKTSELEAGHAYTMWVVVFNNPEACEDGCGLDDLTRPDVAATLAYGGGHVVGPSGEATFSGHLQEGDTSGFPSDFPLAGQLGGADLGLVDAEQAEIHLVVRDHGEVIPGRLGEQLHTFSGGSDVNTLSNVQFAAHHPS